MNHLNQQLRDAFMFQATDLRVNRGGQLSKRQQVLLKAARSNSNLAMGMFLLVMLGTGGFIAYSVAQPTGDTSGAQTSNALTTALTAVVAITVVIVIGYLISRKYMATLSKRQISVAKGKASIASNVENNYQVKIGSTKLRMPSAGQLAAFQPATEYRIYYIAGPVPIILSGEQITEGVDQDEITLEMAEAMPITQDPTMKLARGGRTVLLVLAFLVVEISLAGVLISQVSGVWRLALIAGLFVQAIGFVWFALWRMGRD